MAQSQWGQKWSYWTWIGTLVWKDFVQVIIYHVEIGHVLIFKWLSWHVFVVLAETDSLDRHIFKDHVVASQSASLIRKHVRNLPELFIQIGLLNAGLYSRIYGS